MGLTGILRHYVPLILPAIRGYTKSSDGFRWHFDYTHDSVAMRQYHEQQFIHDALGAGDQFVDVGAHHGSWTVRAAKCYDRVAAFEPFHSNMEALRRNVTLNHLRNVALYEAAISSFDGETLLYSFPKMYGLQSSLSSEHPVHKVPFNDRHRVRCATLDSFGFAPDLLKIDVEGEEVRVLSGGGKTVERTDRIIVEAHSQGLLDDVKKILEPGFRLRVIQLPGDFAGSVFRVVGESL